MMCSVRYTRSYFIIAAGGSSEPHQGPFTPRVLRAIRACLPLHFELDSIGGPVRGSKGARVHAHACVHACVVFACWLCLIARVHVVADSCDINVKIAQLDIPEYIYILGIYVNMCVLTFVLGTFHLSVYHAVGVVLHHRCRRLTAPGAIAGITAPSAPAGIIGRGAPAGIDGPRQQPITPEGWRKLDGNPVEPEAYVDGLR